jgi:ABC-type antimicrobial peptide transport system permease subunit
MAVSIMAVLLTSCAIYGVMARATLNRAQETGVRRAVGSTEGQVILMFMKESFGILSFSLLAGGLAGILATNLGIARLIPSTLGSLPLVSISVMALLASVVIVATLVPSLKLVSMEPGDALAYE